MTAKTLIVRGNPVLPPAIVGFFGSVLLAVGAIAIGWLPPIFNVHVNSVLESLRLTDYGQLLGRTAVVLGGVLVLHAWLSLGPIVLRGSQASVKSLWWYFIAVTAPVIFAPPMFSRDVYSYIAQGRLLVNNIDPYTHGVAVVPGWFQLGADPAWAETPTPYGPVFLMIQHFIAAFTPTSPWWAMVSYKFVAGLGVVLIATAVRRLAQQHGIDPASATWLAVLNPLVLMHLIIGAHNDSLMIGLMLWAFVWAVDSQRILAIITLALAVGIKPIALLALPFIVLAYLPRTATFLMRIRGWAVAIGSVFAMLYALGAAQSVGMGWISALGTPGAVRTLLSPATAIGQAVGIFFSWFGINAEDLSISIFRTIFLGIALLLVARLTLFPYRRSPLRGAAIAFAVVVILSPVVQPWYLLWALPLISCAGLSKAWHLRTIVVGTGFFVLFSLAEVNIVTDSTISLSDFVSVALAGVAVVATLLASSEERTLALGDQFAGGLWPRTPNDLATANSLRVIHHV